MRSRVTSIAAHNLSRSRYGPRREILWWYFIWGAVGLLGGVTVYLSVEVETYVCDTWGRTLCHGEDAQRPGIAAKLRLSQF